MTIQFTDEARILTGEMNLDVVSESLLQSKEANPGLRYAFCNVRGRFVVGIFNENNEIQVETLDQAKHTFQWMTISGTVSSETTFE